MTITDTPATKPTIPADAPAGMRIVRTRGTDSSGNHRWALAARLTAENVRELAEHTGWRRLETQEARTGCTTSSLDDGEQALTEGDWAVLAGDHWTGYSTREMNQSFTSVRGGVLSGR